MTNTESLTISIENLPEGTIALACNLRNYEPTKKVEKGEKEISSEGVNARDIIRYGTKTIQGEDGQDVEIEDLSKVVVMEYEEVPNPVSQKEFIKNIILEEGIMNLYKEIADYQVEQQVKQKQEEIEALRAQSHEQVKNATNISVS